jgi:hypothetical protein
VEEFPLAVINSLSINKKMTGETVKIFSSGNQSEIRSLMHGQGDALVRAYYTAKKAPVSAPRLLLTRPHRLPRTPSRRSSASGN